MFGTARNIALLNEFPHWCVDGTFKVAPQFFTQVYTVHALINNRALPMIYVQSDQQESKSEQALQIIGHVVAKSYAHKRSKHGRRQFMVSNAT
jgi:hypothetical protein